MLQTYYISIFNVLVAKENWRRHCKGNPRLERLKSYLQIDYPKPNCQNWCCAVCRFSNCEGIEGTSPRPQKSQTRYGWTFYLYFKGSGLYLALIPHSFL